MGVKRLSRGKLLNTEKLGIEKKSDIDTGPGMEKAIVSATQHREGYKVITDIVVDLGTSKDTIKSGGKDPNEPVGAETDGGVAQLSYIAKLASSVFGVVTSVECVCLEMPTDGVLLGSTTNAYKLIFADNAGKIETAPGSIATVHADMDNIGALGEHSITSAGDGSFGSNELDDKYVYIATGAGANVKTAATATITVTDTDVTNLTSGVTYIRVTQTNGTTKDYFAASGGAFDATNTSNNTFNIGGTVNTAAKLARGISIGIHGDDSLFSTDAASRGGSSATITITQKTTGVEGNRSNFKVDAPSQTSGIVVGDFTGGTTSGTPTAMTAGKFLIRVTGFMTPADL